MSAREIDEETLELHGTVNGASVASCAVAVSCNDDDGCKSAVVLTRTSGDLMAHRTLLLAVASSPHVVTTAPQS